ncbi:MAG: phospho-sugar mutase [Planctomycetia bacterium]|nr:phospho-sugar mutase [Planctomycetia bacterium]
MPAATDRHLAAVAAAHAAGRLTDHSAATIREWLTAPRYGDFSAELAGLIEAAGADPAGWKKLDDVFWTVIPFGTGGRRGLMFPVGSNAINDRTIGESAQGLADYVRQVADPGTTPSCAIAYDTRHRSEHFARLCTEVLLAAGFHVHFLRGHRSTPELSFAVRHTGSTCGIMVTASHNPPSDNAVKVYWSGGVQVLPPHDKGIIERVMAVETVHRASFDAGVAEGRVRFVEDEIDAAFIAAELVQAAPGPRDVSILYTPLHGVGATAVVPVLRGAGFTRLRLYGPHERPDGDFPNVPGHVANPENPQVLAGPITEAVARGDDLVLASDPDCDRLGAAAPQSTTGGSDWEAFTGNQLGALLADHVLTTRKARGLRRPADTVITTLVTTGLVRRVATGHGAAVIDDLQVGFKWIGREIDRIGPERFVFGCEESHGYQGGTHVRDKDAAAAALFMAELAGACKAAGRSIHQRLDDLFTAHGCHLERQVSLALPGAAGMERMRDIMAALRQAPPAALGGLEVVRIRDYGTLTTGRPGGSLRPFAGNPGDLVMFDLAGLPDAGTEAEGQFPALGNCVAARPSGTEPKIKFYLFAVAPPGPAEALPTTKQALAARLDALERDLRALAGV